MSRNQRKRKFSPRSTKATKLRRFVKFRSELRAFVSFVVIWKFSQSARIFNYSNTKSTKKDSLTARVGRIKSFRSGRVSPLVAPTRITRYRKFWYTNDRNLRVLRDLRGERYYAFNSGYPQETLKDPLFELNRKRDDSRKACPERRRRDAKHAQGKNSKHEIRNSKQSQMTQNRQKLQTSFIRIRCFGFSDFENFV